MSGKTATFWLRTMELLLALLAALIPLAFFLHSYDALSIKGTLFQAGALVLCGAWLLKGLARGRWEVPAQAVPMLLPALLLAAWTGARLWASPAPLAALPGALSQLLGLALFAVALLECGGADSARRFSSCLLAAAWTAGLYALLQRLGLDPLSWRDAFSARPFATLGSPSALGLFAAACAPLALSRVVDPERENTLKAPHAALLALLALAAAGSFEGLAAFAAAGAVSAVALPAFLPSRSSLRAALAGLIVAAVAVAGGLTLGRSALSLDAQRDAALRRELWSAAAPLLEARPVLGYGPGAAALALDESRTSELVTDAGHGARPEHVPGLVIETLCELGLPGALLWLWLFGSVLSAAWKAHRRFIQRAALRESAQLAGLAASLTTLLLVGQWSLSIHDTAAGWLLWPLAGLCGGLSLLAGKGPISVLPIPLSPRQRKAVSAAALPAVLALLILPARWQAADVTLNRAVAAADQREYGEAARLAQAADVAGAPHALEARYVAGQSLLAAGRPQEALVAFARLENEAPSFGQLQYVKGRSYMKLGEWQLAAASFERQRRLDPTDVANLELLAAAAKQSGDYDAARRAALAAIALDPSDPLPKLTLSQVNALERKAATENDERQRARKPRSTKRSHAG